MKRIIRLTESDLTRIVRRVINERTLLTESTLKELDPSGMAGAKKFFAAEFAKLTNGPQYASQNLIYVAHSSNNPENMMKYNINVFKFMSANFGVCQFLIPVYFGMIEYHVNYGLTDNGDLEVGYAMENMSEKTVKDAAYQINVMYESILPELVTTNLNAVKANFATQIASIKTNKNFASLGPLLKGSAKTVYDLIAV